jgi:hypothetical protein
MMSSILNLKQIERKAFQSTYQDGVWDIFMGLIVAGMAMFVHRAESGYSAVNLVCFVLTFTVAQGFYWGVKRYVTLPRMGQVRFGSIRRQKKRTLAIVLGLVVFIQVLVVGVTVLGWLNPVFGETLFGDVSFEHLAVAAIGSLFVGPSMLFVAYMNDFLRGYYIAILLALAVFLMIYFNQPIYTLIIAGLIILPGLVLLIRFLRLYPIPHGDESNGRD